MQMNLTKKTISALLAATMSAGVLSSMVFAADDSYYSEISNLIQDNWEDNYIGSISLTIGSPDMLVDGATKEIDPGKGTAPQIINDRTMLPIRAIVEELGGDIGYDGATRTVEINLENKEVEMTIDENVMSVDGILTYTDTSPVIINDRTFVPVRAVTENLLCDVEWKSDTGTVVITKSYQTKRLVVKGDLNKKDYEAYNPTAVVSNGDITVLQFDSMADTKNCCDALSVLPGIEYAEPDEYIPPVDEEEDSLLSSASSFNSWGVEYINADKYAEYTKQKNKNGSVTVAVVDTGVYSSHPYLSGKVMKGYNFVKGNSDATDDHGHGTHVAGTIIDCMPNLNVKILPVKVLNEDGCGTSLAVANGIDYAVSQGADVINLSLGGAAGSCKNKDVSVNNAVAKGTALAVAAGNESTDVKNRCFGHLDVDGMVVVAAHDSYGKAAYFSNYGQTVDIAAPGVGIKSCVPSSGFEAWNGTSMATPHVAACLAMIKLANPDYSPAELEKELLKAEDKTVTPYYAGKNYGKTIDMTKIATAPQPSEEIKEYKWQINGEYVSEYDLPIEGKVQVKLIAILADNSTKDVTNESKLYVINGYEDVVSVTQTGAVTAEPDAKEGDIGMIHFNYAAAAGTVIPKPLEFNIVKKAAADELKGYKWKINGKDADTIELNITDNKTAEIRIYAIKSVSGEVDVTSTSKIYALDDGIVEITKDGKLTAKSEGSTEISFNFAAPAGITIPKNIVVKVTGKKEMTKLEWSVRSLSLEKGKTAEIKLFAVYSDGSKSDVTEECIPYASDESIAVVSGNEVKAVGSGKTTIWIKEIPQAGIGMPGVIKVDVK